jgi:hypothetical protein
MTMPRPVACRFCTALATGTVRASGGGLTPTGEIPHCDAHWDYAYERVRAYPDRLWRILEQPQGLF